MAGGVHDERYQALIQQLKNARTALGLSQEEVARGLGKRQQFVSKYESGERRLDVLEFMDVAHQLGLDWQRSLSDLVNLDSE